MLAGHPVSRAAPAPSLPFPCLAATPASRPCSDHAAASARPAHMPDPRRNRAGRPAAPLYRDAGSPAARTRCCAPHSPSQAAFNMSVPEVLCERQGFLAQLLGAGVGLRLAQLLALVARLGLGQLA